MSNKTYHDGRKECAVEISRLNAYIEQLVKHNERLIEQRDQISMRRDELVTKYETLRSCGLNIRSCKMTKRPILFKGEIVKAIFDGIENLIVVAKSKKMNRDGNRHQSSRGDCVQVVTNKKEQKR